MHERRRLRRGRVVAARRAVAHRRRPLRASVRYDSDDHYITAVESRRQRHAHASTTRARSSASCGTRRPTSTSTRATARASRRRRSPSSPTAPVGTGPQLRAAIRRRQHAPTRSALKALIAGDAARSTSRCSTSTRRTRSSSTRRPAGARRSRTRARRGAAASRLMWDGELRRRASRARRTTRTCDAEFTDAFTTGTPPLSCPRLAAARRAVAAGVRRARLDAGRLRRLQRRGRGAVRRQALRQRSQHRRRAGVHGRRTCASGFAQTRRARGAARVRARQQHLRPQLRRAR